MIKIPVPIKERLPKNQKRKGVVMSFELFDILRIIKVGGWIKITPPDDNGYNAGVAYYSRFPIKKEDEDKNEDDIVFHSSRQVLCAESDVLYIGISHEQTVANFMANMYDIFMHASIQLRRERGLTRTNKVTFVKWHDDAKKAHPKPYKYRDDGKRVFRGKKWRDFSEHHELMRERLMGWDEDQDLHSDDPQPSQPEWCLFQI